MANILVIDDELMVRTILGEVGRGMGHAVSESNNLTEGLHIATTRPFDVIYLDVLLPDGNGLDYLQEFKNLPSSPEVIVITGYGNADGAELAVRHGVWEYLQKPLTVEHITLSLSRVLSFRQHKDTGDAQKTLRRNGIIGSSPSLLKALDLMSKAAGTTVNSLLLGETGTGKELFSRAIHLNSKRANGQFVTLDCAAFTDTLIESQLFGHSKGAFTGADRSRDGLLKLADGGTLFLDEIGDLPLHIQGTFLRALESRTFRPIGAQHEVESDFRLIAATNKDLHEMVRLDMFRADLLYRLRGLTIPLPALRERKEDIPAIAEHYLQKLSEQYQSPLKEVSDDFMEAITTYDWPGNVREMVHALDRAFSASIQDPTLFARHLPTEIRVQVARKALGGPSQQTVQTLLNPTTATEASLVQTPPQQEPSVLSLTQPYTTGETVVISPAEATQNKKLFPSLKDYRLQTEKDYVVSLLKHSGGNIKTALSLAGCSRGYLYELMKKHNIKR